ncbi:type II secretion system minor pseudopilin GspI [Microbulbifer guangxiensis]|uniref:type II secretion system minor pseudopilin GspI n=1 Tax=Microbulbifer guangxiensis TaxID=2904249 RepID=UPI001F015E6B|nr:type II secretion system minor pseudopilin GspI [Microbulbifer guangxiensis]
MTRQRGRNWHQNLNRHQGFTLIEVLVALTIFGVIAASVLRTMHDSVRTQAYLEERLAASWVAQQALAEIRLQAPWPPLGKKSERIPQGHGEWLVTANVEDTSEPRLRHITIEVMRPDAENPAVTLDAWAAEESR